MAVSVALFGWGFGGIGLHFFKQKFHAIKLETALMILLGYSISMPVYLLTMMQFQFSQNYINLLYVISLTPFFLAGVFLTFFYSEYAGSASKLYLADLVGASCACLVVEPILVFLGAESTVLFLGVINSVVCVLLASLVNKRKVIAASIIVLVFTCTFFAFNVRSSFIAVSNPDKVMFKLLQSRSDLRVSFTKWNSFSRVDVVEGFGEPLQAIIYIDAGASTDILRWDGKIENIGYLRDTIDFLPYCLVDSPKTLIIGSGGGRDVLVALVGNSSKITAVELNPIVIEAVQRCKEETADVYSNQKTELYVDEGRSFIKRSNEKFDVITLTLVDSWAAISAGGYTLAENYLYTKEVFIDYINHLTDNGLLMMIRWAPEVPRLISTVTEAFATLGEDIHNVGKHVAVVLHDVEPGIVRALFVLKKTPFTQVEAETFLNQTQALGTSYHVYYIPYVKDDVEPYSELFDGLISLEQFCNVFPYRVDAVSDDSPYYFNIEKNMPRTLGDLTMLALSLTVLSIMIPWVLGSWVKKGKM
jgi:spermidine synthase